MKLFIIILIILLLCGYSFTYSQHVDSLKLELPPMPGKKRSFPDSLKFDIKDPDIRLYPENYDPFPPEEFLYPELTFKLPARKRGVFNKPFSKFIVPASLIAFGAYNRNTKSFEELDLELDENGNYDGKKTSVDDYLRYTPYLGIYAPDLMGIKAKHNFRDRTFVTLTSFLIMDQAVNLMKDNIPTWRPNGENQRSFPSSHTATAFVGAHIMFKEYKDSSPWIASTGYVLATATGALRIVNECHSLADVAAGAGVGILSAEFGYLLLPVFHKVFGIKDKNKNLVILPSVGVDTYCVGLVHTF